MSGLSNIELRLDALAPRVTAALELILDVRGKAARENIAHFLASVRERNQDLSHLRIVQDAEAKVRFAALPLMLPGRCAMLLLPASLGTGVSEADAIEAILRACESAGAGMIHCLIEPEATSLDRVTQAAGFRSIATLQFCSRTIRSVPKSASKSLRFSAYSPERRSRFETALQASYEGSLDCPVLAGTRSVSDIVDTHQSSGLCFDPSLWQLAVDEAGNDVGVVLLSMLAIGYYELTYLGVSPPHRGRGYARTLMLHAFARIVHAGGGELSLAVDSRNAPARKLYDAMGFSWMYDKLALARW